MQRRPKHFSVLVSRTYNKRPISHFRPHDGYISGILLSQTPPARHRKRSALPIRPKHRNVIREYINIILIRSQVRSVPINHTRRPGSVQIINIHFTLLFTRRSCIGRCRRQGRYWSQGREGPRRRRSFRYVRRTTLRNQGRYRQLLAGTGQG